MKFRSLLISVLVLLLALVPAAANAQGFDTCFGLAEADCAELNAAGANFTTFAMSSQSFTIEFDIQAQASGLPQEQAGATSAAFSADGALDIVMGGNGTMPITLGAILNAEYGMDNAMESMAFELRLVDDFIYILNPMTGAWQGANLADAMADPEIGGQIEQMNPMNADSDFAGMIPDAETIKVISSILDLPGLITHVRDGNDFIFTLDLTVLGLLGTPDYADRLATLTAKLNELQPGSGDQLAAYMPMLPMIVQRGTISLVQTLNPELGIVDQIALNIDLAVDGSMMGSPGVVDATMAFNLAITNVNSAPAAVAPAEFEEVEPAELLSSIGM
jgi:hypothetical protein